MPDSQNFDTSTNTLTQLIAIDSQLSVQEAQLLSQLKSIQEKRKSLQVVISLFTGADKTDVVARPQAQTEKPPETVDESQAIFASDAQESPQITPALKKGTTTVSFSHRKSQSRKKQTSKAVKHSPRWQQYLVQDFRNSSLPQAISLVLQSQAERVWEISSVIEAIFVKEMPQEVRNKVRHQITNLLAQGVKENKWYRGQQGSYTMSSQAAQLASTGTSVR